jgi:hypothetical protein
MNKLIKITILPALCLLSMGDQAGIVSTDWKLTNDGLATLDDVSGKEWLKLTQTDGMIVASVVSQLFHSWIPPLLDGDYQLMKKSENMLIVYFNPII